MTTLADKAILLGADNRPPMLEKDMYDLWKSIMELYMLNRQHGGIILEPVENGPLLWLTVEENGVTKPKKYSELSATEAIQADCDVKPTNIILQGLPPEVYALCTTPKRKRDEAWFKDKVLLVQAQANRQVLHEEELEFLADPGINSSFLAQQDDLILSVIEQLKTQVVNCTKINQDNKNVNEILTAELERYKDQLEPKLYDGSVIQKTTAIVIRDSEETLMLEDESRSKMLQKQKDPMMSEKKVNTKPVDYAAINQLSHDFETRFVPQTEFSTEQVFWSQNSVNSEEPNLSIRPTIVEVVQIILWYLDSGCSKHMTRDRSQLINFVHKFLGTVKFENDHVAKIVGYGDYKTRNVTISRVYFVEGLRHNLFFVGQFCDSDLEVAFRQHTCFILNLDGVDLLTGSRRNNLYTLSLGDMMASSPICLLSKALKTKSWLWHRHLSHLNFGGINHLSRQGLVRGLPKLKLEKDHLCSACAMGKSKKKSHKPKSEDTNQEKLYLLHMNLCEPMRVESVNGKKYILVIVDDYSRFTWVKCLRSKDEASDFIIKFLKTIQVRLKVPVRRIRTDNGTKFVNQALREYYENVGISYETSVARSPQQNSTPYELLPNKLPNLSFLHVFGALCYPTNDSENLGKLQPKADVRIFIGYAPTKKAFRIYNRRTRRIVETIHVDFDELMAMASEQSSSGPALNEMTHTTISLGLFPKPSSSTPYVPPSRND
nr:retrovirus-related Pol polyprotein from transposon TNT 1-94 [Tanacetum cinerariifolium]